MRLIASSLAAALVLAGHASAAPLRAGGVASATRATVAGAGLRPAAAAQSQAPISKEHTLTPGTYARFSTSEGEFVVRLFEDRAPKTVANFIGLAEGTKDPASGKPGHVKPFYDGLVFHRIIPGFMIQGGDPLGTGRGGPNYTFPDEFDPKLTFDRAGLLAMANRGPSTNGSQFFITLAPTEWLNNKHTIFGEAVEGLDVVTKIGSVRTGPGDRPVTPVVLNKLTILHVNE